MVDTPKEGDGDEAMEDNPPRSNLSIGIIGAALSPTIAKAAIPAQETITLRIVLKTTIIPSMQTSSGRMKKLALWNRQQTENQRMTITCPSPKMR